MTSSLTGIAFMLLAAFLWSLIGLFSSICLSQGMTALEIAFWRTSIGCVCFMLHMFAFRQAFVPLKHLGIFLLFGVLGVALFSASLQLSIQYSGAAMAVVLLYSAPIWVAVYSYFIFGDRLDKRRAVILAVACLGTGLVCFSGGSLKQAPSLFGIACGLLSGICYAAHYPFNRWWQTRYSTAVLYAYGMLGGTLTLFPFVSFVPQYSLTTVSALLGLGLFTVYGAYWAYGQGLKRLGSVHAAILCNLEPVLATVWAYCFLGENFTYMGWFGAFIILLALLALQRRV